MSTIKRFEEIDAWQLSRSLSNDFYRIISSGKFKNDFPIIDQMNRSISSVMDNLAEGFERDGKKEFRQHLSISKGSIGEFRSQLYRAFDRGYINSTEFDDLLKKSLVISSKIKKFISYLNSTEITGTKFKLS